MRINFSHVEDLVTGKSISSNVVYNEKVRQTGSFDACIKRTGSDAKHLGWIQLLYLGDDRVALCRDTSDPNELSLLFPFFTGSEFRSVKRHGNFFVLDSLLVSLSFEADSNLLAEAAIEVSQWSRLFSRLICSDVPTGEHKPIMSAFNSGYSGTVSSGPQPALFDGLGITLPMFEPAQEQTQQILNSNPTGRHRQLVPQTTMPTSRTMKRISLGLQKPIETGNLGFGDDLKSLIESLDEKAQKPAQVSLAEVKEEPNDTLAPPTAPLSKTMESSPNSESGTPSPTRLYLDAQTPTPTSTKKNRLESILQKEAQLKKSGLNLNILKEDKDAVFREPPNIPPPVPSNGMQDSTDMQVVDLSQENINEIHKTAPKQDDKKISTPNVAVNVFTPPLSPAPQESLKARHKGKSFKKTENENKENTYSESNNDFESFDLDNPNSTRPLQQLSENNSRPKKTSLMKTMKRILRKKSSESLPKSDLNSPALSISRGTFTEPSSAKHDESDESIEIAKVVTDQNLYENFELEEKEPIIKEDKKSKKSSSISTNTSINPSVVAIGTNSESQTSAVPKLDSCNSISALSFRSMSSRSSNLHDCASEIDSDSDSGRSKSPSDSKSISASASSSLAAIAPVIVDASGSPSPSTPKAKRTESSESVGNMKTSQSRAVSIEDSWRELEDKLNTMVSESKSNHDLPSEPLRRETRTSLVNEPASLTNSNANSFNMFGAHTNRSMPDLKNNGHSTSSSYSSIGSRGSAYSNSSLSSIASSSAPSLSLASKSLISEVTLYAGNLWISKWQDTKWVPLSQAELPTEVTANSRNKGTKITVKVSNTESFTVQFLSSSEIRRISVHDVELKTEEGVYMFRGREIDNTQCFFKTLWAINNDMNSDIFGGNDKLNRRSLMSPMVPRMSQTMKYPLTSTIIEE